MTTATADPRHDTAEQRAINKARSLNGAQFVTAYGKGRYSVLASNHLNFYTVQVYTTGRYSCTCPASDRDACYHRASVWMYRVAKRAKGATVEAQATTAPVKPAPRWQPWQIEDGACLECAHVAPHHSIYCTAQQPVAA